MAKYRCTVCNWIYDDEKEGTPFDEQPGSYTCPVCGAPKSAFVPEEAESVKTDAETTVADKIIEQLEAFGVKHIYGIPGDSNLPLIDSIRRSDKIKFILTRHEETAAFMATAHGKMTGRLGVCISIAGPGATNLITGLMDGWADRVPVLALVGEINEAYLGSESFQEIDQLELFHPFTEYSKTIAAPDQALKLTLMAAKYAYRRPGVSALSTPTGVLGKKLDGEIFKPVRRLFANKTHPDDGNIQKAADLIDGCNRVAFIGGYGVKEYGDKLLRLAEKLKAPVATTSRAKGVINETHPHSLGVLGSIGSIFAAKAIQAAQLVIVVGSGFRHVNLIPAGVKTIQIDHDPTRVGRTFDVDIGLVGDAGLALDRLYESVSDKETDDDFWANVTRCQTKMREDIEADAKDLSIPINPGYVIQAMKRHSAQDAMICVDVGDHTYWFFKKYQCEGQSVYLSANIASMGFALPASLAAQLDNPGRQVICFAGDGGFGMLAMDFTTAVREKLPINVVVFNEGKLKNIKKEQERDNHPEFGVSFPNPNFAEFAASCGGEGYRIEDPRDLDDAMIKAFASDKPALIEVLVDPDKMAHSAKKLD